MVDERDDAVRVAWRLLKEHATELPDSGHPSTEAPWNLRFGTARTGVGLAIFAAASLESQGKPGMAVTHLNDAIAVFSSDRAARAQLLAGRALIESLNGTPDASESLQQARRGVRSFEPEIVFELDVYTAIVGVIQLRPGSIEQAERNQATAERLSGFGMSAGMKPWTITAMHAFGMAERSAIWITSLAAFSEAAKDTFRRADVAALDYSTQARSSLIEPDGDALATAPLNTIARWRVEVTRLCSGATARPRRPQSRRYRASTSG